MTVIARLRQMGVGMAALALALLTVTAAPAQGPGQSSGVQQGGFVLKLNGDLVLTNVVARDAKTGDVVRGLKASDFQVWEDGKPQHISTFDFQSVDMAAPLKEATVSELAAGPDASASKAVVVASPEKLRNHRLIVMFFDLTSMQP